LKNLLAYKSSTQLDILPQLKSFRSKITDKSIYHPVKGADTPKISAVIITYNEEVIISETLSRLWWCAEIIIVDSGSTDRTVEICKEYGCNVYIQEIDGFGRQKLFGVSKAKNDWILCIDADELLSDVLVDEIQEELINPQLPAAFEMPLNLVFMNKIFKYGRETNSFKIRLFNKNIGNWNGAVVHEKVEVKGHVKKLKNKIFHYSYSSYSQFLKKIDLYSSLSAKKLAMKKTQKSKLIIVLGIPFNFCKYYFVDGNFLNGYRGFTWAVLNSLYHFIKYLKYDELNERKSTQSVSHVS
jgi:glycosyltransferase involved in cell wall biosynthesis